MAMKLVLLGEGQVGKTSIVTQLVSRTFRPAMSATIGIAFQPYTLATPQGSVTIHIWDTAGQEQYRALTPMYYRSADVALLVYDVTTVESFDAMEKWLEDLKEKAPTLVNIIIVGNKIDLIDQRTISEELGKGFAQKHSVKLHMEVSAKTGQGIVELFTAAAVLGTVTAKPHSPTLLPEPESRCC
jgi:Ras-related protein Rab-5C